ncbi:MAG: hypothetical protein U5K43_05685 [Halofilum sp. (in: g-proteobacteria)]|nr:hypothetical protein [Halofilum sp. (in: g-proteobacteria)]
MRSVRRYLRRNRPTPPIVGIITFLTEISASTATAAWSRPRDTSRPRAAGQQTMEPARISQRDGVSLHDLTPRRASRRELTFTHALHQTPAHAQALAASHQVEQVP